ncbi:MAG: hypothetical protein NTY42_11815 [Planctomycetota bacterium]|nr:hypothetical protein [Planctomycetota bacterium]
MNKKHTQHSRSASSVSGDSIQRPRVLGWLILAAGGFSAWYWYKPLPHDAGRAAYSNWDHNASGGNAWSENALSETSLIRPSLDELVDTEVAVSNTTSEMNDNWAGNRKHGLIPVPTQTSTLSEILSTEPQPTVPELSTEVRSMQMMPRPWVETTGSVPLGVSTGDSNTKVAESFAAPWPDTTYRQHPAASEIAQPSVIPSLLNSGQQHFASSKIRTQENEAERSYRLPVEPIAPSPAKPPMDRTPHFIRQPKR